MKRSMGMLASTLLAAGLGIGGTAIAAGPAAADTGLQSVTVSAENYQSYTDNYNRDRDRDHRNWCERHGHWHYYHHHWYWQSDCDRGRIH
jgi:shikimate 5-dehydrogenase